MSIRIATRVFTLAISVTVILIYANVSQAEVVTDGLVSYWNFDGIAGGKVQDVVGGHNGTFDGPIEVVDGEYGKAVQFDGTGAFVRMDDPEAFNCNEPFTWCAWIKTEAGGCIVSKTDGVLDSDVQGAKTFMVQDGVLTLDVGWVGQTGGTTQVNDDKWHYVAITVENDAFIFYSDGEDAGQGAMAVSSISEEGFVITVGWDPRCGMEFAPFDGIIDEVSHYSRALAAEEIEQNFNAEALESPVEPADRLTATWGAIKISN